MGQQVNLGEPYGIVEFPDSHTPEDIVREFDSLEAARKTAPPRASDLTAGDYVSNAVGRLIRGAGGMVAGTPEQLGIAASGLARLTGTDDAIVGEGDPVKAEDRASYQLGQSIRRATANVVPTRKELDDSFWASKVPEAVGAALGFVGGGVVGKALKIPQWLGISGLGAAAGGAEFYHDAKASGADEGTAQLASVIGSVVGTSEAVPLSRMMRRLDGVTGGTFSRAVWEAGKDTLEEALQEGAQSLAQNLTAQQLYDKDRELFNSVAENAGVGGVTGFLLSAVSQAIGIPIGRSRVRREQGVARRREAVAQFENERIANAESLRVQTPPPGQEAPAGQEEVGGVRLRDDAPPRLETQPGEIANAIPTATPTATTTVPPPADQGAATPAPVSAPGVPQAPLGTSAIPSDIRGVSDEAQPGTPEAVRGPQAAAVRDVGQTVHGDELAGRQRAIVEQAIADVSSRWQNGPEIAVVDTSDQFPDDVRAEARSRGIDLGRIPAVTDARGKVWLSAAAIPDEARARQLILHEAVGHVGVEAVFGTPQEFATFMQGVARRHLNTPLGLETRSLYGADPVTVGKEIVAKLAENPQADPTLWQQIVAAVRNWVRRIFNVEISDNDIQVLLRRGETAVESQQSGVIGRTRYFLESGGRVLQAKNATVVGPAMFAIEARHGTPHKISDRFSTAKIGSGEGSQAYGWGLYFAQLLEVAETYARIGRTAELFIDGVQVQEMRTRAHGPMNLAIKELIGHGDLDFAITNIKRIIEDAGYYRHNIDNEYTEALRILNGWIGKNVEVRRTTGNLYTVTLKADPEDLLDWDLELKDQSEKIKAKLMELANSLGRGDRLNYRNDTGKEIYGALREAAPTVVRQVKWSDIEDAADAAGHSISPALDDFLGYQDEVKHPRNALQEYSAGERRALVEEISSFSTEIGNALLSIPQSSNTKKYASDYLAGLGIRGIKFADKLSRGLPRPANLVVRYHAETNTNYSSGYYVANGDTDLISRLSDYFPTEEAAKVELEAIRKSLKEPTYNYVIFNDADITITHENGQPVPVQEAMDQPGGTRFAVTPANQSWNDLPESTRDALRGPLSESLWQRNLAEAKRNALAHRIGWRDRVEAAAKAGQDIPIDSVRSYFNAVQSKEFGADPEALALLRQKFPGEFESFAADAPDEPGGTRFAINPSRFNLRALKEDVAEYYQHYVQESLRLGTKEAGDALENAANNAHERAMKLGLSAGEATQLLSDVGGGMSIADAVRGFGDTPGGTRFAINPDQSAPGFFRNRANVRAAKSNPGLTPSAIQEAEDLAAVQSSMVTGDMVNWLVSIPSAKFEIRAQKTLDYLLARATLSPTPRPLSSFPEGTTEEQRTKELAGALQLSHHAVDRSVLSKIYGYIDVDQALMNEAVMKAGKLTATQHKANYLTALFNALTARHRQYIIDLRAAGPASANVEAQWNAALNRAQERLNEQDASPIALRHALSAIAKTIPDSILTAPGASNQDVINWVTQQGALITVVGQNVRDWLLVDDGTGTPALSTYAQLIPDLQTLKDIEINAAVVQADIDAFESWFRNNANSAKVSSQEYAQKYFQFRTGRDRALKIIAASDKEIDRLDTKIRGNIMARDKLEAMMADPAYSEAVREAAEKADTVIVSILTPDAQGKPVATGLINRDKVLGSWILKGPIYGGDYIVDLHPTTGQEAQNKINLRAYVTEAESWALGHSASDPLLADEYTRLANYIKKELLHPSFDPKEGFTITRYRLPGTNIRVPVDIFDGITSLTGMAMSWQTIRDVIERIGGRTVREAFKDADVLDRTMRKIEAIDADPKYGRAAQTQAVLKALASHGWAPDQSKRWDEQIAEPILASGQNKLSPIYELNDFVVGSDVRITAADLAAIRLMKQWGDAIIAVAPHTIQDRLHDLGISRRAIGNGRYTSHRVKAHWAEQFVDAWNKAPTDADKAKLLAHDDEFRNVVLGYLAEFNPEFSKMNPASSDKSPLFEHYRRLATTEKQGVQKFRTWDEVISFLADRMVATGMEPDLATARAKAQEILFGEIKQFISDYESKVIGFTLTDIYGGVPTAVVQRVGTNNAFTTPRGRLIAPSTFYSYSTAMEARRQHHIGNLRSLLNLKLLQSMSEATGAMEDKKKQWDARIQELSKSIGESAARRQVQKETAADRELGNIRYDYREILTALQAIEQAAKEVRRYELSTDDHYQHSGVAAANNFFSTIKSSLLSSVQAMTTNTFTGALLGPALVHWQAGRFGRAVGDVVLQPAMWKTVMLRVAALVEGNPTMKKLLNQHAPLWEDLAEAVVKASADWRRVQQIAQSAGMVNPYNLGTVWKNMAALKRSGGRLVNDDPHSIAEAVNMVLSAPGVRHVTEGLKATTPRLLDNFINYVMVIAFDQEVNFLRKVGWAAFKARETAAAGTGRNWQDLTDRTNVLQPGDLGLKTHKALEVYRQLFVPLGSLDVVLLDFYNRTQGMSEEQRESEPLLSPDDHAAMALQYAAKSNVSTETNRPYSLKGKGSDGVWRNVVGTFMGWAINMMHQLSKGLQTHSKDPKFPTIQNSFIGLATIVLLMAAVGAWNWEFGDELTKFAYGVSSARVQPGNVVDSDTAWLYFFQSLVNTVPMIGSSIGGLAGVAYTGRGNPFDLTSLSLHIGFVAGIYNTVKRIAQTGDATLPMIDFTRQWVPMSKIVLNRMPVVQGIVDQQNAVRGLNASAPPGTEIKWGKRSGGDAKYGPANDEIQKLISSAYDAAARGGSIEDVQARMQEAVAAYVAAGRSQPDAMKALGSALSAKEPIRVLTGREMTPEEERKWVARMTTAQKADYDRATAAWQILGAVTGKNLNMVTAPAGGSGGGGRIPSRAVGLGGGGGSRLGVSLSGGGLPSGFGSVRSVSSGGRRRRTGTTRRRRSSIGGRPNRRRSLGPRLGGRTTTRRRRSLGTRRRRSYSLA